MTIPILIIDDHGLLRAGLRALLSAEEDLHVVGEAATGQEALRLSQELQPKIVLMDINLPDLSGVEVTRQLKEQLPAVQVLILTVYEDESLLEKAMQAGAAGYIVKRAVESELINAIRAVNRGDLYIHPTMTRALLKEKTSTTSRNNGPADLLTPREIEVLRLIAQGYTNRQMADQLSISVRTVETHRANLMGKLELRSRVELVRYARDNGLLD